MNAALAKALSDLVLDNDVQGLKVITEVGAVEIPVTEVWIRNGVIYISVKVNLP